MADMQDRQQAAFESRKIPVHSPERADTILKSRSKDSVDILLVAISAPSPTQSNPGRRFGIR
jgi:hypothetical protein